ncbi:MAG TPA: hypothetical protein VGE86_09490, partial [Thermoanaerobaculia bacterium]
MDAVAEGAPGDLLATAEGRLRDLCAISSPSGDAAGIRRVAEYIAAELRRHALRVEIAYEPDAAGVPQPILLARGPAVRDRH